MVRNADPDFDFIVQKQTEGHAWAVVLAGGEGTRLRPLTRLISGDDRPKQFCPVFGDKTLLRHTRDRLHEVIPLERTLFVVTQAHEYFYRKELNDVPSSQIVVQPLNRGTAAAIAYALLRIAVRDPDAVVAFFPSDHHYEDQDAFRRAVKSCLTMVQEHSRSIILLGAEPTSPEVEYGWIEPCSHTGAVSGEPLFEVGRFLEKPPLVVAQCLARMGWLWNTFVMTGHVTTFLDLMSDALPGLLQALTTGTLERDVDAIYETLPAVDFSKAVLARCLDRLLVFRLSGAGWSDLGDPRRVMKISGAGCQPAADCQSAWSNDDACLTATPLRRS